MSLIPAFSTTVEISVQKRYGASPEPVVRNPASILLIEKAFR
jgi:hypothetical protein